ncbi:hypothetical protein [Mesorhizobium sp. M3A.F.Ca.ET.080.04.2.1]|uniref:hypothetical protein n=1 Tax=Mesorhizobium sp. M3A.F.Ca.ET.080.04.2.1 TaxID=2493676 RepID=UPI001FDFC845|nr:hypothetical protein [Mesorhizobium sp. M3A.F.Ca.ET.080.04.2.1]
MHGFAAILKRAILAKAPGDPRSMLIAVNRNDGLGGRLLAMANAKSLADRLGYRFGFSWNSKAVTDQQSHTVDVVEKIFSAEFIDRYWLGDKIKASKFGVLGGAPFTPSDLDAVARQGKLRGWVCDHFDVLDYFRDGGAEPVRRSEALRSFGFSREVRQALEAAGKCRFPGPMAALHLRSGDIIYGHHRRRLVFAEKAIPSTLAKAIVAELSARGLRTLLIGQDRTTLDYLKAETGAWRTDDFGAGEFNDETQHTFFEMALMARCQQIHAGGSIYAAVASAMGDVPSAAAVFGNSQASGIILEELRKHGSDYHPLDAAFGYQWAFLAMEDDLSPARAREILERASALDPANDAYDLKFAAVCFRQGDHAAGEARLKSLMGSQHGSRTRRRILPMLELLIKVVGGRCMFTRDLEAFLAAARAGHPHAMACAAYMLADIAGEARQALEMATRLVEAEPNNRIFRQIRRRAAQGKKPRSGRLAKARWRLGLLRWR